LYGLADFERSGRFADRPDIEPVLALLRELGDPHKGRVTVHIAGSKGKGSVAAMVESMVRAAGYTTGLYTSPHLHRFPERIQVSSPRESQPSTAPSVEPAPSTPAAGPSTSPAPKSERGPGGEAALLPITRQEFAEGIAEVAAALERVNAAMPDRRLLTFDALTALGFWAFRRHDVQVQVIEVGLGGLLDSTNVFQPEGDSSLVTVITNIGLEHREILGDTVPEVARQKA